MPTETQPFTARQSILSTFSRCPRSALFELDLAGYRNPQLNRGSMGHRVMEEMFRTLNRTGEPQMGQEDALSIMREVLAQQDTPSDEVITLGPREMLELRQFVIRLASDWPWNPARFLAIEEQFYLDIVCPDGVTRRVTGTPDLLVASPADTMIEIVDAKSGWGPPKTPTSDDPSEPKRYLTARGHFQLDTYGLLVLRGCRTGTDYQAFPRVRGVRMREIHPRAAEERTADLMRDELGNVENELGSLLMLLDRANSEGPDSPMWEMTPEVKDACAWCWGRSQCPRATAPRGIGLLTDEEARREAAGTFVAQEALRAQDLDTLKAEVNARGPIALDGGRVLGWYVSSNPESDGRQFGSCHRSELHPDQFVSRTGHRRERLLTEMRAGDIALTAKEWAAAASLIYVGESDSACAGDLRALVEQGLVSKSDSRPARFAAVGEGAQS